MDAYGIFPLPLWRVWWKTKETYLIGILGTRREVAQRLTDWIAEQNEDAKAQKLPPCCLVRRRHFRIEQVKVQIRRNSRYPEHLDGHVLANLTRQR